MYKVPTTKSGYLNLNSNYPKYVGSTKVVDVASIVEDVTFEELIAHPVFKKRVKLGRSLAQKNPDKLISLI